MREKIRVSSPGAATRWKLTVCSDVEEPTHVAPVEMCGIQSQVMEWQWANSLGTQATWLIANGWTTTFRQASGERWRGPQRLSRA